MSIWISVWNFRALHVYIYTYLFDKITNNRIVEKINVGPLYSLEKNIEHNNNKKNILR